MKVKWSKFYSEFKALNIPTFILLLFGAIFSISCLLFVRCRWRVIVYSLLLLAIDISYILLVGFCHLFLLVGEHALQGVDLVHLTLNLELVDSDAVNQIYAITSTGTIEQLASLSRSLTDLADLDPLLLLRTRHKSTASSRCRAQCRVLIHSGRGDRQVSSVMELMSRGASFLCRSSGLLLLLQRRQFLKNVVTAGRLAWRLLFAYRDTTGRGGCL